MDSDVLVKHKLLNFFQSAALVLILAGLVAYLALVIAGELLAWFAFAAVVILFFSNASVTPHFILRMYNASPLARHEAPALYDLVHAISQRAGLKNMPDLYYIPSRVINAFALGSTRASSIAISDGVLRKLSFEELAGVLAHEITHIRSNDIRVMMFADIAGWITKILSLLGQLLILINLPLIMFTEVQLNWVPLIVMVFAPLLSDLIQLGLSRVREYDADLGSALLLKDARPLASALAKMEHYKHNFLSGLFIPVQKIPEPSLLRTHPPTEERIRRLMEFHKTSSHEPLLHQLDSFEEQMPRHYFLHHPVSPRRRMSGFWY